MKKGQKWIAILAGVVILGSMFADRLVGFYTDWLWFDKYEYKSVLLTILGAQFGLGLLVGGLF
ncbi:MAG: COG1615 family transporter, partial [bacterium]|nr:COG1615 family transporter [bacterium]